MPDSPQKPPIFLSHSSEDRALVGKLVTMLEYGPSLPPGTIFCSSLPGRGIPNGKRFIDYIRGTIDETKLAVFLVSCRFLESKFCIAEYGAAWVKSVDQMILLVYRLLNRFNNGRIGGRFPCSVYFVENFLAVGMPDVAFWFQVMLCEVKIDGVNELGNRSEAARQDGLLA
jgi:TIR domain